MLDSARGGKKMPEKSLIVLGGSTESQKEFLESLSSESSKRRPTDKKRRPAPVANRFALGYTYIDVLDEDHDGNYFLLYFAPAMMLKPLR